MLKVFKSYSPAKLIAISSVVSIAFVVAITLFVHLNVNQVIKAQKDFAAKIDTGGYQRMLSQRIVFYTTEFVNKGDLNDKNIAIESNHLLLKRHQELINTSLYNTDDSTSTLFSGALKMLYFEAPHDLDSALKEYVDISTKLLAAPKQAKQQDLVALKMKSQTILEKFDNVVQQYELESQDRVEQLSSLQLVISISSALLFFLLVTFVIRPLLLMSEALSTRLHNEANRDYLTGLHNRRIFSVLVEQAIAISNRGSKPLSIVLFDIDNFKIINDQFGHQKGDELLKAVARALVTNSRESDKCFRFGGDEFVMILPFTDARGAHEVAENICKAITNLNFVCSPTLSAGVSCLIDEEDNIEKALLRADQSMYQAKNLSKT